MNYISLFSGAGCSDYGFEQAGMTCLAQVEIDKQANAVRKRHWPGVRHFEDIRRFDATEFRGVDVVIGGFPCTDVSVAGKRAGLAGGQTGLFWEIHRVVGECRPRYIVLENVPGLLSSNGGQDFRTILDALAECGYPNIAWRILDLRYLRVPQRRRRVFIVASLRNGCCGEILFEPESLRRHPAEGREARESDLGDIARCLGGGSGARGFNNSLDVCGAFIPIANTLRAEGFDASDDGTGRQTYIPEIAPSLSAAMSKGKNGQDVGQLIAGTLSANTGGMTRPAGNANELDFCIPICDTSRGAHADPDRPSFGEPDEAMYSLLADKTHGVAVPFAQNSRDEVRTLGSATGALGADPGMKQQTYLAEPMAFNVNDDGADGTLGTLKASAEHGIQHGWRVRRLTPTECERLTGLPDGFTRYTFDGREVADGPRYRMLGNAWAAPQAEWIARRIMEFGR